MSESHSLHSVVFLSHNLNEDLIVDDAIFPENP
jgi:hypothetical protein